MLGPLDKKFSGGGGGIEIIATSSRVQVETLRVDLELNLTIDLERVRPGPKLVNYCKMKFCRVCDPQQYLCNEISYSFLIILFLVSYRILQIPSPPAQGIRLL